MTREEMFVHLNALKHITDESSMMWLALDKAIKSLEQESCEDEYIKVPKKALKYRTAGMIAYNAEWLKNHFDMERAVICGEQEPCELTAEEYRQRMIQAFHNADTDELIAICVLPTEKEFEHLEWLLKNYYKKELCEDAISREAVRHILNHEVKMPIKVWKKLFELVDCLPPITLQPKTGHWIPVSERLPVLRGKSKISDDVLITNGFENDMGYLVERKGKIFWHYYGGEYEVCIKDEDNDATAWMPLPEPYKAESEE